MNELKLKLIALLNKALGMEHAAACSRLGLVA
jgi:hypothetical protein